MQSHDASCAPEGFARLTEQKLDCPLAHATQKASCWRGTTRVGVWHAFKCAPVEVRATVSCTLVLSLLRLWHTSPPPRHCAASSHAFTFTLGFQGVPCSKTSGLFHVLLLTGSRSPIIKHSNAPQCAGPIGRGSPCARSCPSVRQSESRQLQDSRVETAAYTINSSYRAAWSPQ